MKKMFKSVAVAIMLCASTVAFTSCGTSDAQKMKDLEDKKTEAKEKYGRDSEEYRQADEALDKFNDELEEKYKDDPEGAMKVLMEFSELNGGIKLK